jgi:hypothetical protein
MFRFRKKIGIETTYLSFILKTKKNIIIMDFRDLLVNKLNKFSALFRFFFSKEFLLFLKHF